MARLCDICHFINGDRGKNYPTQSEISTYGDIPFINAGHIIDGKLDFSEMNYISQEKYNQLNSGKIQEDDILYCLRGSLGKKAIVKGISIGAIASSLVIIRPNIQKVNSEYLFYALESPTVLEQMMQANNGTSQPNLSAKSVGDYKFNLPAINEQIRIVSKLGKVNELISLRKQQLAKLDELVKARFVELFGDQKTNPYNLEVGKLSDVADIYLGLTHTPTYVEQGRPFLSVRDISSGVIDFSNCHYITEEEFDSLPKGARPQAGDMLFCRVGTIGKPVIIPENTPEFGTFVSVGYLRKKTNVNNCYLKAWMENEYFMRQVYDNVAGASQINLNTGWLKNFRILIPPIDLQNQFTSFVEQTDKSKLAIQQSLNKLETLKKALMQKYFG